MDVEIRVIVQVTGNQAIQTSESSNSVTVSKGFIDGAPVLLKRERINPGWQNQGDTRLQHSYNRTARVNSRFVCRVKYVAHYTTNPRTSIYITEGFEHTATEFFNTVNLIEGQSISAEFSCILLDWLTGLRDMHALRICHGRLGDPHALVVSGGRGKLTNLCAHVDENLARFYKEDRQALSEVITNLFEAREVAAPSRLQVLQRYLLDADFESALENIGNHPLFLDPMQRIEYLCDGYMLMRADLNLFQDVKSTLTDRQSSTVSWITQVMNAGDQDFSALLYFDPRVQNDGSFPQAQQHLRYWPDTVEYFRFCRNAGTHYRPDGILDAGWAVDLDRLLERAWPDFIDELHYVLEFHNLSVWKKDHGVLRMHG